MTCPYHDDFKAVIRKKDEVKFVKLTMMQSQRAAKRAEEAAKKEEEEEGGP